MFTVIMLCDARCESACSARATRPLPVPFSPVMSTFASDGATREINSSTGRIRGDSAMMFGALPRSNWFAASSRRPFRNAPASSICVRTIVEQPLVVPRLRNKIARPAFHRFHRQIDRRPRRHHHDRQRIIERLNLRDHLEPFLPRSRVARVIQVHDQERVILFFQRLKNPASDVTASV